MSENALVEFYRQILESVDCDVDDDAKVYIWYGKEKDPVYLNVDGKKKHLVLPTQAILRDGDWDEVVAFHPACESVYKGHSEVINLLIDLIGTKLYLSASIAAAEIISLAVNTKEHSKLKMKQTDMLSKIGDASPTAMKYMANILKRCTGTSGKHPMLTLRLKNGETVDDAKYSRTCRIIPKIIRDGDPLLGVRDGYSKSNGAAVRNLFQEVIFPEEFIAKTNREQAPNLRVLLECYYEFATHLNELRKLMGRYKGRMDSIRTDWYSQMKLISDWKKYIGVELPGNTGKTRRQEARAQASDLTPNRVRINPDQGSGASPTPEPAEMEQPSSAPPANFRNQGGGYPSYPQAGSPGYPPPQQQPSVPTSIEDIAAMNYRATHQPPQPGYPPAGYQQQYPPQGQTYPPQPYGTMPQPQSSGFRNQPAVGGGYPSYPQQTYPPQQPFPPQGGGYGGYGGYGGSGAPPV